MAGGAGGVMRVAVIGCGAISDEHLAYLSVAPGIELVSTCDLSPAIAELTRERYGATRADTDAEQLLGEVRPDVVHVLAPPVTHVELIERALAAGSHVICEKPLAPSAAETERLLAQAREAGRVLIETRNLLYNDAVLELDRDLAAGAIGDVRDVDVSLSLDLGSADVGPGGLHLPAGLAHDYLPHLAYLLLHFAPELATPSRVAGWRGNRSGRPEIGCDHVDALVATDAVSARLRISPDTLPHSLRVIVRGTKASRETDLYLPYVRREGSPWIGKRSPFGLMGQGLGLVAAGTRDVRDRLLGHTTYHGMGRLLADVYDALRTGRTPPVTPDDVRSSAMLIDRIVDLELR